jgi:hypothetical protein
MLGSELESMKEQGLIYRSECATGLTAMLCGNGVYLCNTANHNALLIRHSGKEVALLFSNPASEEEELEVKFGSSLYVHEDQAIEETFKRITLSDAPQRSPSHAAVPWEPEGPGADISYLVLATSTLWKVLKPEDVVAIILHSDAKYQLNLAELLHQAVVRRGGLGNITVSVINLTRYYGAMFAC